MISQIQMHPETAVHLGALRGGDYVPNYRWDGDFIDDFHAYLASCPTDGVKINIGIHGWLRTADALKLYECAYFSKGDVLEFGTNRGLSAYIMSKAIASSRRNARLVTMELKEEFSKVAAANLKKHGAPENVDFESGDADAICSKLIQDHRNFGFAFVDHSHAHAHVVKACHRVDSLLVSGALCAFHDYTDKRNTANETTDESEKDYGVFSGVQEGLKGKQFSFVGVYGCCGVFRKDAL